MKIFIIAISLFLQSNYISGVECYYGGFYKQTKKGIWLFQGKGCLDPTNNRLEFL